MPKHRFKETRKILEIINQKERIRNIGIIAHIDHGKTTMTDSLLRQFLGPKIRRWLGYIEEEQKRGITIKTANISLVHRENDHSFLINLIDTRTRVPVAETFGLSIDIRHASSGHAFWQSTFDHWEKTPNSNALGVIRATRKRRDLPMEVPKASCFIGEA